MALWAAGITGAMSLAGSAMNQEGETGYALPGYMKKTGKDLSKYFRDRIGEGLPGYEGDMTAPLSEYEQMGLTQLGKYINDPNLSQQLGVEQFQKMISGMSPEDAEKFYATHYDPATQRMMEQQIIPGFKESQVSGGNLRSSGTQMGLANIYEGMGTDRMRGIGDLYKWSQEQANQLLPYTGQFAEIEGGMPQIEAAMQYGGIPRAIQQADFDRRYQEFIRTTPELSPILDKALALMGTDPNAYYQPGQESALSQLVSGLAPGIGQYIGNKLSRQSTGVTPMANRNPTNPPGYATA